MVGVLRRQDPGDRPSTPEANWQPDDFSARFIFNQMIFLANHEIPFL